MRLRLATSLKNKTSSLARDARLLNAVVDTKNRVQKRPSLVGAFGPVTVGNGLGLFVRNNPSAGGGSSGIISQELISITGTILTTAPSAYTTHVLTAVDLGGGVTFGMDPTGGSISPSTLNGATIITLLSDLLSTETTFVLSGVRPSNFFISITISGQTFLSADGFQGGGSNTQWQWLSTPQPINAAGTYNVTII